MKALIAMSGGVDSSVAALLTKEKGYECVGCMMKLHEERDVCEGSRTCCTETAAADARSVAFRLGIPFYVFNFVDEFEEKVICKFINCYKNGRTPNPCIDCNKYMKFDKLYERAKILGCDKIVTGHYARVVYDDGHYKLKKALNPQKDQSYVLYTLSEEQLAHTLFPLGEMTKEETRRIAEEQGFINAQKRDSQDLCFVPDGNYTAVIERYTGKAPEKGEFVDEDGKVLGYHKGIIHYTVGQHKGLGIVSDKPYFVKKILPEENRILLCYSEDLFKTTTELTDLHFVFTPRTEPFRALVKVRYRHKEQPATVTPLENGRAMVIFDEPQRAMTPGQAAVFYIEDEVIGGGVIV